MATLTPSIRPFQQPFCHRTGVPAPMPQSLAPSVSARGLRVGGDVSNLSASAREVAGLPLFLRSSPHLGLPRVGNQCLGITTAVHALYGPYGLYGALRRPVHGGWDRFYQGVHVMNSLSQTALGVTYGVVRPCAVGQVALAQSNPALAASLGSIADKMGTAGGVAGAILYAGAAFEMGVKGTRSALLGREFKEKGIAHLQNLYHVDKDVLENEMGEENLKTAAKVAALAEQKERWQSCIQLANQHLNLSKKITISSNGLEQLIEDKMGKKALEAHGKQLLIQHRQAHNHERMKELIGDVGARELAKADKGEPIELAKIETSLSDTKRNYAMKCLLYTAGAVAIAMLCVYTAGAPFLIASVLAAVVFTGEAAFSYRSTYISTKLPKDHIPSPPGKYDEWFPKISIAICLAALGTAVAVTLVFGLLPLTPLILTGGIALLWIGLNTYQLRSMDVRKQRYIEFLLNKQKGDLQPIEFAYIARHGNEAQTLRALGKLQEVDRIEIERIVNAAGRDFKNASERQKAHLKAVEDYMLEAQLTWIQEHLLPSLKGRH